MFARDRLTNLGLFAAGAAAWLLLGLVVTAQRPTGIEIKLVVAALFGVALALTCVPLFWLAVFARHRRIAHRGDWRRAARRGIFVGAVATLFVVLRFEDVLSLPIALFVVVLTGFAELNLSFRR